MCVRSFVNSLIYIIDRKCRTSGFREKNLKIEAQWMPHNEKRGQAISQSFLHRVSLYLRDSFRRFIYFVSSLILERCNLPKYSLSTMVAINPCIMMTAIAI